MFVVFLLTPLREGRPRPSTRGFHGFSDFYSRPCGRGDRSATYSARRAALFLLTPLREGRRSDSIHNVIVRVPFLLTPLREGRPEKLVRLVRSCVSFLLTPLREGRRFAAADPNGAGGISTHAPAGGATQSRLPSPCWCRYFYSRPCGRGDESAAPAQRLDKNFYSRPCGRGDLADEAITMIERLFLLTPLREGRQTAQFAI